MATSGYTAEELQPSQSQGGNVTTASSTQHKATSTTTSPFLSDMQSSPGSASAQTGSIIRAQATPSVTQKKAVLATPPQGAVTAAQYVAGEIQSPASQAGNGQSAQQYIVVTVTEGSLHSNDSESSSPPAGQTGVPTQVVQQVQTAQRSVVQAPTKSGQLGVSNLHITPEHVYSGQFVEGDTNYNNTAIRSNSYPFTDPSLYPQATPSVTYYETSPTTGSQVTSPATTQAVSGTGTGVVSMFSEGSSGITVVTGAVADG